MGRQIAHDSLIYMIGYGDSSNTSVCDMTARLIAEKKHPLKPLS